MISSVREIREVNDEVKLLEMEQQFHRDLDDTLEPLLDLLDRNIRTSPAETDMHVFLVERWRGKLVRYLSLATAFVEHSKSESFLRKKEKGITDTDREAHKRQVSAGFVAQAILLEGLITCVDSRVNLCKKLVGIEVDGAKYGRNTLPAAA